MQAKTNTILTAKSPLERAWGLVPAGVFLHGRMISPLRIFNFRNILRSITRLAGSSK
jgi:hypothetical protein